MFLALKVEIAIPIRLDRYLKRQYNVLTQGQIEQAIRKGRIKVNNKKQPANYRVNQGDEILISTKLNLAQVSSRDITKREFSAAVVSLSKKLLGKYLLFDHPSFLAINKPSGVASQGGSKIALSIDDALVYLNQENSTEFKIVHRLDKDTSGVLLIAKGYEASVKLGEGFRERKIQKTYLAIVSPAPKNHEGEISSFITSKKDEEGKLALTRYKVLGKSKKFALVEFAPLTGRMHQLRIHSKELGCPIVGDKKYGGIEARNLFLHAYQTAIPKSIFGEEITITAPKPDYFSFEGLEKSLS
jgi:23S rRNA pseudouridine955/2504/2580 synthase